MDDSFDLFGGLPTASKGSSQNVPLEKTADTSSQPKADDVDITPVENNQPSKSIVADEDEKLTEKQGTSLVSSIGNAGTAMAFVPQAIRKKKKVVQKQPKIQQQQQQQSKPLHVPLKKRKFVGETLDGSAQNSVDVNKANKAQKQETGLVVSEITWENVTNKTNIETSKEESNNDNNNIPDSSEPYLENEPESLRLLHASVTHPYDPHFPNDYLEVRERKKTEQVRKDMQRNALQRLDQQEKMRKKIEEERKKILESGDFNKIVESQTGEGTGGGAGRGRGRGRGVANLPAWLVKKQQEQKEAEKHHTDGQFDD